MNQTNCRTGWATDQVLWDQSPPDACDMSVALWLALGVPSSLGLLLVAVLQFQTWLRRETKRKARGGNATSHANQQRRLFKRSLPIVPLIHLLVGVSASLFVTLVSVNVAYISNGGSVVLFALAIGFMQIESLFFLLKFVSLGLRLIRGNSKWISMVDVSGSLSRLDLAGKVSVAICTLAISGQFASFLIFFFVFDKSFTVIRVAFAFNASFWIQFVIANIVQIQRIKDAIKEVQRNLNVEGSVLQAQGSSSNREMFKVRRRLRLNQLAVFLPGFSYGIICILVTAEVIALRYYIAILPAFLALLGTSIVAYTTYRRGASRTRVNMSSSDKDNPQGQIEQRLATGPDAQPQEIDSSSAKSHENAKNQNTA